MFRREPVTVTLYWIISRIIPSSAQEVLTECFEDSEFTVVDEIVSFDNATKRCTEMGGFLAGIVSDEENRFVANLTTRFLTIEEEDERYWLGRLCSLPYLASVSRT